MTRRRAGQVRSSEDKASREEAKNAFKSVILKICTYFKLWSLNISLLALIIQSLGNIHMQRYESPRRTSQRVQGATRGVLRSCSTHSTTRYDNLHQITREVTTANAVHQGTDLRYLTAAHLSMNKKLKEDIQRPANEHFDFPLDTDSNSEFEDDFSADSRCWEGRQEG